MALTIGSLKTTTNASTAVSNTISDVGSIASNTVSGLLSIPTSLLSTASGAIASQINQFSSLLNKNSSVLKSLSSLTSGSSLGNVIQNVESSKVLSNAEKYLKSSNINKHLVYTTTSVNKIVNSVNLPDLSQSVESLKSFTNEQLTALASKANLPSIINDSDLSKATSNIVNTASNYISSGVNIASDLISLPATAFKAATEVVSNTVQTITNTVGDIVEPITDALGNVISPITDAFGRLVNPILGADGNVIDPMSTATLTGPSGNSSFYSVKRIARAARELCSNVSLDTINFAELKDNFNRLLKDSLEYCTSDVVDALSKCSDFFDQDAKSIIKSMMSNLAGNGSSGLYDTCLNIIGPGQITNIVGDVTKLASVVKGSVDDVNSINSIIRRSSLDPYDIITSTIPRISDSIPILSSSKVKTITASNSNIANSLYSKNTVDLVKNVSNTYS